MKTKFILGLVVFVLSLGSLQAGTFTNLAVANNVDPGRVVAAINVEANQKARIVNLSESVVSPNFEFVEEFDATPGGFLFGQIYITHSNSFTNLVFYGPVYVEFACVTTSYLPPRVFAGVATLEILPASTDSIVPLTSIPSTAVAIPADNGGPVTICLESSVDMITWNAALPGIYGTSTTNRFFRVRAVRN